MPEKCYHTLNTDSQDSLRDKFYVFSRNKRLFQIVILLS